MAQNRRGDNPATPLSLIPRYRNLRILSLSRHAFIHSLFHSLSTGITQYCGGKWDNRAFSPNIGILGEYWTFTNPRISPIAPVRGLGTLRGLDRNENDSQSIFFCYNTERATDTLRARSVKHAHGGHRGTLGGFALRAQHSKETAPELSTLRASRSELSTQSTPYPQGE